MPTLDFPSIVPSTVSFGIKHNTQINVSTLSGATQTIEIPGARWVATMSFDSLEPAEARLMASFLTKLRGASGRFKLYDYSHPTHAGTGSVPVAVLVSGTVLQGDTSINTTGWATITPGEILLKEGDYIQLEGNEVKMVSADVVSNGTGAQAITFEPPVRTPPSALSSVVITNCTAIMLLSEDESRWDTDNPGLLSNFNINCTEAF